MRLTFLSIAGPMLGFVILAGWPALQRAESQTPPATAENTAGRARASDNLPSDFIDSRPIIAYFDDQEMPDTVRGLLEELKRADRCGKGADLRPEDACALVLYRLGSEYAPDRLRPPFIMKAIYRVTDPENPADTIITMPDSKGVLQRYAGGDLYEPLRNIRANICLKKKGAVQCNATDSKGVLYLPYAILGKIENDREGILPAGSAHKHFAVQAETPEMADWLKAQQLLAICRLMKTCQ